MLLLTGSRVLGWNIRAVNAKFLGIPLRVVGVEEIMGMPLQARADSTPAHLIGYKITTGTS